MVNEIVLTPAEQDIVGAWLEVAKDLQHEIEQLRKHLAYAEEQQRTVHKDIHELLQKVIARQETVNPNRLVRGED